MPATINRDLASEELWQRSLDHSRRRRELAASARKDISKRKSASVAISAALAASPVWPSVAGSASLDAGDVNDAAKDQKRGDQKKVLVAFGDKGSAVMAVQKALKITVDGDFGPLTEAAVKEYQDRKNLKETGEVDVRTWLKLFPNDAIIYASGPAAKAYGFGDGKGAQWAAVKVPEANAAEAGQGEAVLAKAGGKAGKKGKAVASIATVGIPGEDGEPGLPTDDGSVPTMPVDVPGVPAPDPGLGGGTDGGAPGPGPDAGPPTMPAPRGSVGEMIKAMIAAADRIDKKRYPYRWGGGHNMAFSGPYDCSGAVSAVLHSVGLLKRPMVSGEFTRWGAKGPGAVTIYANNGHVYMSILGRFFGTTRQNPAGGAGWFKGGARPGFAVVHVPFERISSRTARPRRRRRCGARPSGSRSSGVRDVPRRSGRPTAAARPVARRTRRRRTAHRRPARSRRSRRRRALRRSLRRHRRRRSRSPRRRSRSLRRRHRLRSRSR